MKVVVFETEEWERQACLALGSRHAVQCVAEPLGPDSALRFADAEVISTFVNSRLDAEVLARFPDLRLVATRSTGFDHIDLAWCRAHGIAVANVPDYGDATVAEHAFALLLALARHLVEAVARTRRGHFSQAGLRGIELHGRTLGVVGTGKIGRRAIAIARGFGMDVVAHDLAPDAAAAAELGFRYAALDEVLAHADVLTLHVPGTAATRSLVSDREFALMKAGALLINTARGGVVDVEALVRALAGGRLGGAGLDVLPEEPLIREEAQIFRLPPPPPHDLRNLVASHALLRFDNVLVTPHIAYNTGEAVARIVATTVRNIERYAEGRPENLVARPD